MQPYLVKFFKFCFVFLSPIFPIMVVIGVMIMVDTYFGRRAARVRGEEINSHKMRSGLISKMIGYQIAIITLFIIDFWAINEIVMHYVPFMFLFTKMAGGYIIYIEWTSINESYKDIKGYTINSKINEFFKAIRTVINKITDVKNDVNKLK